MLAPLLDSRGKLRYFIGAPVDVSGLMKDCTELGAFRRMLDKKEGIEQDDVPKDEFQELCEMFNDTELNTIRKYGGMHRKHPEKDDDAGSPHHPRLLIKDPISGDVDEAVPPPVTPEGRLSGVYKNVRNPAGKPSMLASLYDVHYGIITTVVPKANITYFTKIVLTLCSISSFGLRRHYASSLPRHRFASLEFSSHVSSIA